MKIAVVGCGALGSFYGAKLARAGHELHFLLRSDYEAVRQGGVTIQSLADRRPRAKPPVVDEFVVRPFVLSARKRSGPLTSC
jgi:ketopantoate reductase